MANEAVIIELLGNRGEPISFTVANATGVEKGTLMTLQEPKTAVASSTQVNPTFAGIAAAEKVASDGATKLSLYTYGIFDLTLVANAGTVHAGDLLVLSGANTVTNAGTIPSGTDAYGNTVQGAQRALLSGMIVGKALEDGSSSEVINVLVGVY